MEYQILDWIQRILRCNFLDFIMPKITTLGNVGMIWILCAIVMLAIKKYRAGGICMGISLITGTLIGNLILKNFVARDRPCWNVDSVSMLISVPTDYSFPSGHTLASFASSYIIFKTNKKLGVAAYVLAVLIAFSRLYLYVHFPTDVLAGAVIGTAIAVVIVRINENISNKKLNANK